MKTFHFSCKKGLVFIFLIFSSFSFFSCQSDSPTGSLIDGYTQYDWSIENTVDSAMTVSAGDGSSIFLSLFSNKSYRVAGGAATPINFQDTAFGVMSVQAFDGNYAVFTGYRMYGTSALLIKIYDNGQIRSYEIHPPNSDNTSGYIYVAAKDNFFFSNLNSPVVYHFLNGTITSYPLDNNLRVGLIGAANGSTYVFTGTKTGQESYVFKFNGSSFSRLPVDFGPYWPTYNVNNDFIRVIQTPSQYYYYFTEQGWVYITNYSISTSDKYSFYLGGISRDNFTVLTRNDSTGYLRAKVWNGNSFLEQKNFPQVMQSSTLFPFYDKSDYKDKTVVFYYTENGGKILRGKFKGQ
jgi:hypothetical protein